MRTLGKQFYKDLKRFRLFQEAAILAYSSLLSLIPILALAFSTLSIFKPLMHQDFNLVLRLQAWLIKELTETTGKELGQIIQSLLDEADVNKIGLFGFATLTVILIHMASQIENTHNRIWGVKKPRRLFTRFVNFWTFLTFGAFVLCASVVLFIQVGFNPDTISPTSYLLLRFGLGVLLVTLLFKLAPNCKVNTRPALFAAIVTVFLLRGMNALFALYVSAQTTYTNLYGMLAIGPIFLIWLYLSWVVLLFGASLSWRLQRFQLGN